MPRALIFYPMAKDPAVLFYTSDFLTATYLWTDEEVGKYIRLLCIQHQGGPIPETDFLKICGPAFQKIAEKFQKIEGKFFNKRMQEECERRKNFTESRKKNLFSKKKSSHMEAHMAPHMEAHMETETETITDTKIKEGGMGGDLWMDHRRMFLEDGGWQFKFCTAKALSKYELHEYMRIFIEDIELKSDYKVKKELQRHFTNWFNLQKKKNGKRTPKNGTYQLLEELRQEHEAGLRSQAGAGS